MPLVRIHHSRPQRKSLIPHQIPRTHPTAQRGLGKRKAIPLTVKQLLKGHSELFEGAIRKSETISGRFITGAQASKRRTHIPGGQSRAGLTAAIRTLKTGSLENHLRELSRAQGPRGAAGRGRVPLPHGRRHRSRETRLQRPVPDAADRRFEADQSRAFGRSGRRTPGENVHRKRDASQVS